MPRPCWLVLTFLLLPLHPALPASAQVLDTTRVLRTALLTAADSLPIFRGVSTSIDTIVFSPDFYESVQAAVPPSGRTAEAQVLAVFNSLQVDGPRQWVVRSRSEVVHCRERFKCQMSPSVATMTLGEIEELDPNNVVVGISTSQAAPAKDAVHTVSHKIWLRRSANTWSVYDYRALGS